MLIFRYLYFLQQLFYSASSVAILNCKGMKKLNLHRSPIMVIYVLQQSFQAGNKGVDILLRGVETAHPADDILSLIPVIEEILLL